MPSKTGAFFENTHLKPLLYETAILSERLYETTVTWHIRTTGLESEKDSNGTTVLKG